MSKPTAIVAALEREVKAGVRDWRCIQQKHGDRAFKFFESERAVLVCGGIGPAPARRATEAIIALYQPARVVSLGFAGALSRKLKVGELFTPERVINLADGSRVETGCGHGVLLSVDSVLGKDQKLRLSEAYAAQAIDMEAAAVARGAEARGVSFHAVKAISDEVDFEMPKMDGVIDQHGNFRTGRFVATALLSPRSWPSIYCLTKNSAKASQTLSNYLTRYNQGAEILDETAASAHPMSKN
jgi:adenosylhomocysteine nucleosidase